MNNRLILFWSVSLLFFYPSCSSSSVFLISLPSWFPDTNCYQITGKRPGEIYSRSTPSSLAMHYELSFDSSLHGESFSSWLRMAVGLLASQFSFNVSLNGGMTINLMERHSDEEPFDSVNGCSTRRLGCSTLHSMLSCRYNLFFFLSSNFCSHQILPPRSNYFSMIMILSCLSRAPNHVNPWICYDHGRCPL